MGRKLRQKMVLGPELPPELSEDEIIVSDEDVQFVSQNRDYAGFVSCLDTQSITKHVSRVAHADEDELEALYKERLKKKSKEMQEDDHGLQVVDALPVKTLDGRLYYRNSIAMSKESVILQDEEKGSVNELIDHTPKPSKAERREKIKKSRKVAKGLERDLDRVENPQAEVMEELREDLSVEEAFEKKKLRLAELGTALLSDPESNIKHIREMLQFCKDGSDAIVKLGLLSLMAVYKDIIPGYRIRLPTEKEKDMTVSKDVKRMRFYESALLSSYKAYLQILIQLERQPIFFHSSVRCISSLLEAASHFNFSESLLRVVVNNLNSRDDVVRKICCTAVKSVFANDGKHRGEVSLQAVHMIAESVKNLDCQLHPDSIEVFQSLAFDEDLGKHEIFEERSKAKQKSGKRKNSGPLCQNGRQINKEEELLKTRAEVSTEYKAAALLSSAMERRQMQTEILSAVFLTYFRVLKHAVQSISRLDQSANHCPLLSQCLKGIGKFAHLLDLDFMGDLMSYLKRLASFSSEKHAIITVSERLQCCIVAFKVMKNNLDALNVDLNDFFVQLYNLLLEFRPERDQGEVLVEALKLMLCEDRQHDIHRAAAFIKRLATFSLCYGSAESMSAMVATKHLLHRNGKCRSLLENDDGGGPVSGTFGKYQPYVSDPNLSSALSSSLWELSLLSKHYHPAVSSMTSAILNMNSTQNQVYSLPLSPQQAFSDLSFRSDLFSSMVNLTTINLKKRVSSKSLSPTFVPRGFCNSVNEEILGKKFSEHFAVLHNITGSDNLQTGLRMDDNLQLCAKYKKKKVKRS